jgi:DNA-binding response OmpR family regulator
LTKVLVIEDEPKLLTFVTRALNGAGFHVDGASDGSIGCKLACSGTYDMLVLDLMLPKMDGVAVLRETRRACPDQRVLVLTALEDVPTKVRCLEMGAVDYLVKPIATAELVARIRCRLRHEPPVRGERQLAYGPLRLDLDRRTVDGPRGTVALASREFLLLSYLMRKQGEVCTRAELLEDVWGYRFDPGSNVVDVYIARLRAKVGEETIETVRNVGYWLVGA